MMQNKVITTPNQESKFTLSFYQLKSHKSLKKKDFSLFEEIISIVLSTLIFLDEI